MNGLRISMLPRRALMTLLLIVAQLVTAVEPLAAPAGVRVDLLTMGAGEGLYTRFGHAAFWVRHRRPNRSGIVYNFGYTNFGDSELITKFLRGQAQFWVAREMFSPTLLDYQDDDRTVHVQRLNLKPDQHQELARLLHRGSSRGKGRYIYHHFNDNCATRLRDLLDRVTAGELKRQLRGKPATNATLRDLIRQGFSRELGLLLLIDLIIGREVDQRPDLWASTFLPRFLRHAVTRVHLEGGPLADPARVLHQRRGDHLAQHDHHAGVKLLWGLAALAVCLAAAMALLARARRRWAGLPLAILCLSTGAPALLIWAVAAFSTLPELRHNELLLSAWPTDLLLLWPAVRWLRGRLWAGRILWVYGLLRLVVAGLVALGQLSGLLIQRPLAWPVLAGAMAVGLWLSVGQMGRKPLPN